MSVKQTKTYDDEWSRYASSFLKLAEKGPLMLPALNMVKVTNEIYPYTSATTVLDLGCGTGELTSAVINLHGTELPQSARLVASDLSPGMIDQVDIRKTDELAKGNAPWNKVETMVNDIKDLSAFSDNSISHALAGFVIFIPPQPVSVMKEIRRVLSDKNGGGVFALSSWASTEWLEIMSFPSKMRTALKPPGPPALWTTLDGVRGEMESAGFRDVDVHTVETYLPFEDYNELATFVLEQFPGMKKMTKDFSEEEIVTLRRMVTDYARSKHPVVPSRLVGTAIVGVGRK